MALSDRILILAWAPSRFWIRQKWNAKTFILAVIRSAKMKVFASNAIAGELNIIYYFSAFSKKSRT